MINESLAALIKSEPRTSAAKEAKKLGLRYMGFGRYAGKNGKVAYLVDPKMDKLVPYKGPDDIDKLRDNYFKVEDNYNDSKFGIEDTKDSKGRERIQKQLAKEKQKVISAKTNFEVVQGAHKLHTREAQKQLFFKEREMERYHKALSVIYRPAIFSEDEQTAIGWYTMSGGAEINSYLYNGYDPEFDTGDPVSGVGNLSKTVQDLDSAFDETETPIPITVYSGLSSRYKARNLRKGIPFVFRGYVSTSLSWDLAMNFSEGEDSILLQIDVPQNSKGIYVAGLSNNQDEYEFLLPRGSMIEVISGPHPIEPGLLGERDFVEGGSNSHVISLQINTNGRGINMKKYTSKQKVKESMNPISEAIMSITEGDLDAMRQHFNQALAQKAVEKLEEHKLTIASNYFGQE